MQILGLRIYIPREHQSISTRRISHKEAEPCFDMLDECRCLSGLETSDQPVVFIWGVSEPDAVAADYYEVARCREF